MDAIMGLHGNTIGICPVGEINAIYPKVIAAHISGYLSLSTRILTPAGHPDFAFEKNRLQYDAGSILAGLEAGMTYDCAKIIGVTGVDLFIPIFTHVFGEARQGGRAALVSTNRLEKSCNRNSPPAALIYERTAKVALHELGHLFNLAHCDDHRCLMHFSGDLNELDHSPIAFCRYCSAFFRVAVSR